jgi:hypothetical protein
MTTTVPDSGGNPVMTTVYRWPAASATTSKGGAAPYSSPISCDTQPNVTPGARKLLDRFRDKMRALHYALATEKAYRHWILAETILLDALIRKTDKINDVRAGPSAADRAQPDGESCARAAFAREQRALVVFQLRWVSYAASGPIRAGHDRGI